jgi:ribosomal-protein-alanine N-acetyltransferase
MDFADIPEVVSLEQAAYGPNRSHKDYRYDLEHNDWAYYFVLRLPQLANLMIGQAGFWLIVDQIHINTIAIHPDWQQLGFGEWLLLTLLEQGQALGAGEATLEVRVSNRNAIRLYRKYQFERVGRRRGYYQNNGEDAWIFTTPPFNSPDWQLTLHHHKTALHQRLSQVVDKIASLG